MSPTLRRWVLLCAAVGLVASGASLYVHYNLLTQPGYASPCDINGTFGCSQAYLSAYGSLFGVPVALLGFLWFVFVVVLTLVGARGPAEMQENLPAYLFAVSTVGLAVILYLAYAAFFVLKEFCVFCLVTYAAVIGLFLLTGVATSIPMTTLPGRLFRDIRVLVLSPLALIVMALFLAGAGSAIAFFPHEGPSARLQAAQQAVAQPVSESQQSDFEKWFSSLQRQTVPVSNDGAAVLIVKFTDYQCPACGASYFSLRPVLEKYEAEMPGAVRLVSKNYPLDQSCNAIPVMVHPGSCVAAAAVYMADQQHRGPEMEEYLYSNQGRLTPQDIERAAATIGHVENWNQQLPAAMTAVKSDIALGQLMQINQTPTFFINGIRLPTALATPQYWDLAIRMELKRVGKLK
jgi:uncharacterized membrane protein/protein-disulfide isomerase